MPDSITLIGGSGFLGTRIRLLLNDAEYQLRCSYSTERPATEHAWFRYRFPDDDPTAMLEADCVIVAARIAGIRDITFELYRRNMNRLAERLASSRVVYVSSDAVFSGSRGGYRESDVANPASDYGNRQLQAERALQAYCRDLLIVRPSYLYCNRPGELDKRLASVDRSARGGATIQAASRVFKSPVEVDHAARMIVDHAFRGTRGVLHIEAKRQSIREFFVSYLQQAGYGAAEDMVKERHDPFNDTSLTSERVPPG